MRAVFLFLLSFLLLSVGSMAQQGSVKKIAILPTITNIHKDALRPEIRKHAKELAHDFLRQEQIFDILGAPSAYGIKKDCFIDVRQKAIEHAQSL